MHRFALVFFGRSSRRHATTVDQPFRQMDRLPRSGRRYKTSAARLINSTLNFHVDFVARETYLQKTWQVAFIKISRLPKRRKIMGEQKRTYRAV